MRKIAIRGIILLTIIICLCMLFSGTVKTITTAKVQIVTAKQGRIEEQIELKGTLLFPSTYDLIVPDMFDDVELIIQDVFVKKGRWVEAGEQLFSASVSCYQKLYDSYQEEYNSAQKDALELERQYGNVRLKRTEEIWLDAYDTLLIAKQSVQTAKSDLEVCAKLSGVELYNGKIPEGVDDEYLSSLQDRYDLAISQEQSAQTAFENANRLGIDNTVIQYVLSSRDAASRMKAAHEKMTQLRILNQKVALVCAPHAGYIVSIQVVKGEAYDGRIAAVTLSSANELGVLRADVSEIDRKIDEGMKVLVSSGTIQISGEVTNRSIDLDGRWYIDVELTNKQIAELGGASGMMDSLTDMTCKYRSQTTSTLLPISAVRGSGENRYVYLITEQRNSLGDTILKVSKKDVHVILESEDTVSIEEDLGRQRIAYMEDRSISDGTEVMAYVQ